MAGAPGYVRDQGSPLIAAVSYSGEEEPSGPSMFIS
jgi:hypothetical protein